MVEIIDDVLTIDLDAITGKVNRCSCPEGDYLAVLVSVEKKRTCKGGRVSVLDFQDYV